MLDSALDLGVNAPPKDRFTFHSSVHCAPITTKGYTRTYLWNNLTDVVADPAPIYGNEEVTDASFIAFNYGPNQRLSRGGRHSNATFIWSNQSRIASSLGSSLGPEPLTLE